MGIHAAALKPFEIEQRKPSADPVERTRSIAEATVRLMAADAHEGVWQ